MIPRFKPYLGGEEIAMLLQPLPDARVRFEAEFARTFDAKDAVAFPYGRSALWAFFKALGIEGAEVVLPAYTCDVVAHAVVLSGNIPKFVDIKLFDYNMDLDQVEDAINERTQVIIATHLFGYPLNVERLKEIVRMAEARFEHKIWVVQDCAHSFGARWHGKLVCNEGDAALFGLNISKQMTSIFGGMLTMNDPSLADRIRQWRDRHFSPAGFIKSLRRMLYLFAVYPAFNEAVYGVVHWLQEETPLLNYFTKAYHLDNKIHFPPDYLDQMLNLEAKIGLAQLQKYSEIVRRRRENAEYYVRQLQGTGNLILPPLVDGATYSHFVVRVADRKPIMRSLAQKGIQLGQLIDYSIPHMEMYKRYSDNEFANSFLSSQKTINIPIHPALTVGDREKIAASMRWACLGATPKPT
ncbi:MAG: DegT/DnrJ/EryC1/StrS aminotransferase family protein [Chloroflexi bacterium]|nr:DegT/DnrJ/EryC1/StrS aminotransferase family protein [Chloroflexota bacterium]